jgi:hypothetical protein
MVIPVAIIIIRKRIRVHRFIDVSSNGYLDMQWFARA